MAPAPKAPFHSRQPSEEKEQKEELSSEEEEEEEEEEDQQEEESEVESSEEEKENFSNEEEEGSSEDEEEDQKKVKIFEPKSVVQENGSDSEPESEGSPSDYKLQPILRSPIAPAKRTHRESDNDQNSLISSKKSRTEEKKSSSTPGGGIGTGGITRLWSNEDEIVVLNGMIDFKNVKGLDPYADMGAFYSFIKGKLRMDFSRDQLRTKVSRMKKRFLNALKKSENGLNPVFSNPHEDMAFELSKKIWGGAGHAIHENGKNDIVNAKKIGADEEEIVKKEKDGEEGDLWSVYPFLSASLHNMGRNFPSLALSGAQMSFLKERLSFIGNVKAKEFDEKWKQLTVEETELNYKMLTLMKEQVKMAFDQ